MASYVIYARKSTESEDRQIVSIDSQIKELQLLAAKQRIAIGEVLTESRSAKRPGRPVFDEMLRRVHRGQIGGILTWKMDRLARNHLDHGSILQALADHQLERIITIDRVYTPDGTDRFTGNFELAMATKYSDDLSQNVKRGIRACYEAGRINHRPALGYQLDPLTRETIPDPQRYDGVLRALHLVLSGTMSPSLVLKIASTHWHLTGLNGKPVPRATFYRMLGNPFYSGISVLRDGRRYLGGHKPMLSWSEYQALQVLLERKGRARPKRHTFALTGILKCGHCGGAITAEEHPKNGRRYVYYRCSRRRAGIVCHEPAISERDLVDQLCRPLRYLKMPPRVHELLSREALREQGHEQEQHHRILKTVEQALAGVDAEADELLDLRTTKAITQERFLRKEESLADRRLALQEKLGNLKQEPKRGQELIKVFDFAQQAQEVLRSGSPVQQRAVLETVGLNYTLKGRKVAYSLDKPFDRMAEGGGLSNWSGLVDDVRKWLLEKAEYFQIPDLDHLGTERVDACIGTQPVY